MKLSERQKEVIEANGHLLVIGGPGSGKTTISILKAVQAIEQDLQPGQKVLFLSFARASVARVLEAIEHEHKLPVLQRQRIETETYHSLFWRFIKAHGYLIGLPRRLQLIPPPSEAIALSAIRSRFGADAGLSSEMKRAKRIEEDVERRRLATSEGRVCFDLFAPYVGDLLHGSEKLRRLFATRYPLVILDEFQDTSEAQWRVVQALGENCRLIALADPEQRIFDFIGADPARLDHFRSAFSPTEVNFQSDNYRSSGTDILKFGNEALTGNFTQDAYTGIEIDVFEPFPNLAMTKLVTTIYAARRRLVALKKPGWSLAVLVPTKRMTRLVSDALRVPPNGLQPIAHQAVVELDGAILGAELVAYLMQPSSNQNDFSEFIGLLRNYFQGKGGDRPTKVALDEATKIGKAFHKWETALAKGRASSGTSIINAIEATYQAARSTAMTGDPDVDWRAIRSVLESGICSRLKEVGLETRNIRLLERGTQLRQDLTLDWRDNGAYKNALLIIQRAFIQEHFSTSNKPETGVVVMNMHKAKGKQFDEVIIFEGWPIGAKGKISANLDRIVRNNAAAEINDSTRQNFRVSVTRGKRQTTILTPRTNPCVLLI